MKNDQSHITPEEYRRYLKGELSHEEAYRLERIMQADPFYSDALEGMELIGEEAFSKDLEVLKDRLQSKQKHQKSFIGWWKYAAAIALVLISLPLIWYLADLSPQDAQLSMEKQVNETEYQYNPSGDVATESKPAYTPYPEKLLPESSDGSEPAEEPVRSIAQTEVGQQNKRSLFKEIVKRGEDKKEISDPVIAELFDEEEVIEEVIIEDYYMADDVAESETATTREDMLRQEAISYEMKKQAARSRMAEKRAAAPAPSVTNGFLSDSQLTDSISVDFDAAYLKVAPALYPRPEGTLQNFEKYLRNNDVFLNKRRKTDEVVIGFVVNNDSSATNFRLVSGNQLQYERIVKILTEGPAWVPSSDSTRNNVERKFWITRKKK